jgi:hypothetical protein
MCKALGSSPSTALKKKKKKTEPKYQKRKSKQAISI